MITFSDAMKGWLRQNWPNLRYSDPRIYLASSRRPLNHVLCIIDSGQTCLGRSTKIVPVADPKFFDQLNALIKRQLASLEEQ